MPKDGNVGLRGRTEGVERVEDAEGCTGDHMLARGGICAPKNTGDPGGVPSKEVIVLWRPQLLHNAELHHKVVNDLLRLLLIDPALIEVLLKEVVEEGIDPAHAHRRPILLLHGAEVTIVEPLSGLLCSLCRPANVMPVRGRHLLQLLQGPDLFRYLLPQLDGLLIHDILEVDRQVMLLVSDESIRSVQRNAAIVANNTAPAISVWEPCEDPTFPCCAHLLCVNVKDTLVVCLANLSILPGNLLIWLNVVSFQGRVDHVYSSLRFYGSLQGFVRLQANHNLVKLLVNVARRKSSNR
mmetsp:Transcript_34576/g.81970  ORF Transcript_34576/g.81970 Transcript_34576/m.81970 type:complete len:296 (-) Transcript_34576:629-1516(-)